MARDASPEPSLQSSGDLIADRRYFFAREMATRGDFSGAADLFTQALEAAPRFIAAWFALGEMRERLDQHAEAIVAYRRARELDPLDRHGAGLHLTRLGAEPVRPMPLGYVRTLFDQYAPRFDKALTEGLGYRGPQLLKDAVATACGAERRFASMLALGCGPGLAGAAFNPAVAKLTGVDVSPAMIEAARAKSTYDRLVANDVMAFLSDEPPAVPYDLIIAADTLPYFDDLTPVAHSVAAVLTAGGIIAFTVEAYPGDGVVLGAKLRFAHSEAHERGALTNAGLQVSSLEPASTRNDGGTPVPGFVVVAIKPAAAAVGQ